MNSARMYVLLSVVWSMCACAPVQPAESAAKQTESSNDDTSAFDAVLARCIAVQRSEDLPISCKVDVVDNVLRMQLVMANRQVAAKYTDSAVRQIATPFCNLANKAAEPAGVVVALYQERIMQVADCRSGVFSAWQPVDKEAQEMLAATQACEALQQSSYPVGCGIGDVDGTTSLVVSYASGRVTEEALQVIARRVGAPFCDATRSSGINAVVLLVEDNTRAKAFDCATGESTPWITAQQRVPQRSQNAGSPASARKSPRGSGSQQAPSNQAYRPSYTLLRATTTH